MREGIPKAEGECYQGTQQVMAKSPVGLEAGSGIWIAYFERRASLLIVSFLVSIEWGSSEGLETLRRIGSEWTFLFLFLGNLLLRVSIYNPRWGLS